jgi:uncharacterized protein YbjT (DUF2867 family)
MKIVVVGGTGLIGSRVVEKLRAEGHEAVPAAPNTGVNTITGEGLAAVVTNADVVVDVSNAPAWDDAAVLEFFETSTRNVLEAEATAGVGHHVALSIVGTEGLPDSGYLRAKVAQEKLIKSAAIPYSIVHATQFFEFVFRIADEATVDGTVRLPHVLFQPIAAAEVSALVAEVAVDPPLKDTVEIGGPEVFYFDELVHHALELRNDRRTVVADPHARYFGTELVERSLIPADDSQRGTIRFDDWFGQQPPAS